MVSETSTSGTADTSTFPLGLISAASKGFQVYELIAAIKAAASDTRQLVELIRTTTNLTAGSAITPEPLYLGDGAAVTTASSAPTGATLAAQPLLRIAFNGRATVRWAAVEPDARIVVPAGGAAAGSLLMVNRNSAAAAIATENQLFFAE